MLEKKKNAYSTLFSNTVIFAIGSFSSKLLVFLLLPLYTRTLSTKEYGDIDLVIQMANLLLPLATLSIAEAIIRFGLDKKIDNKKVISTSAFITIFGIGVLTLFMPLIFKLDYVKEVRILFYIYMITAAFKLVFLESVRASGNVKLYAFNGILSTVTMISFNLVFLLIFKLGVTGYILAIVLSDFVCAVFLFFKAKLYKSLSVRFYNKKLAKAMLKFSFPLIPTAIMWWITNVSDRFLVEHFLGAEENGLYTVAYKLPTIVTVVYAMFSKAWNMSAITQYDNKNKSRFYKNVFDINSSMLYVLAGGLLLFIIPLTHILVSENFVEAYLYSPILIVSTVFASFCSFLGGIYVASKKTVNSFVTSLLGAGLNIILNIILIPIIGINGASLATLLSYFLVFVIRIIDVQRFSKFKILPGKIILNVLLLVAMMLLIIFMKKLLYLAIIPIFLIIFALNFYPIIKMANKILPEKIKRKIPFLKLK